MEKSDRVSSIILDALRYPFTRPASLFAGGIACLSALLFIGILVVPGYYLGVCRALLDKNERLPRWNAPARLLKDGVKSLIVMTVYGVPIMVIGLLAYAVGQITIASLSGLTVIAIVASLLAIGVILAIPLVILREISLLTLAETSDLMRALDPRRALAVFGLRPMRFVSALLCTIWAAIGVTLPILVCALAAFMLGVDSYLITLAILILMPWLAFVLMTIRAYIFARFYRRTVDSATTALSDTDYYSLVR